MVDQDIEIILHQIRERVHSMPLPDNPFVVGSAVTQDGEDHFLIADGALSASVPQTLGRIKSYLTTMERAWDRLPPVCSTRTGWSARLELWLKTRLKVLSRWFIWEQINFNAAVHHAVRDSVETLSDYHLSLQMLRSTVQAESKALRMELRKQETELRAQLLTASRTRRTEVEHFRAQISELQAKLQSESEARRADLRGEQVRRDELWGAIGAHQSKVAAELLELTTELRALHNESLDEQRVCFRQLLMENSDATAVSQQAQQKMDQVLDELTRRVRNLEIPNH